MPAHAGLTLSLSALCVRTFLNKWCFEQGCYHGQLCTMALQRNLWSGCIFICWKLLPWREGGSEKCVSGCVCVRTCYGDEGNWRRGRSLWLPWLAKSGQTAVILQRDQKQMFWNRWVTTLEININSEMFAITDKSIIQAQIHECININAL